jgi:hypothetical protein
MKDFSSTKAVRDNVDRQLIVIQGIKNSCESTGKDEENCGGAGMWL